jgi:hypothetical protein
MAMGRRDRQEQGTFWLPAEQVAIMWWKPMLRLVAGAGVSAGPGAGAYLTAQVQGVKVIG